MDLSGLDPARAQWPDLYSPEGWERLADVAGAFALDAPGFRILNLGCGRGELAALLRQRFPDAAVTALAFGGGPLEADGPFDLVVCSPLFESQPVRESVLEACAALLAPGGALLCLDLNPESPAVRLLSNDAPPGTDPRPILAGQRLTTETYILSGFDPARRGASLATLLLAVLDRAFLAGAMLGERYGSLRLTVARRGGAPLPAACPSCRHHGCEPVFLAFPFRFHLCPACGTWFAARLPGTRDNHSRYHGDWDSELYVDYYEALRRDHARLILEELAALPGERTLLDIGCGYGFFVDEARRAGYQARGIDPGLPACVDPGLDGHVDRVGVLEFSQNGANGRYRVISMLGVLEHVPDPAPFLRQAGAIATPESVLVVSVPTTNVFSIYWLCFRLFRLTRGVVGKPLLTILQWGTAAPHVYLPSRRGMDDLIARELDARITAERSQPIASMANIHKRVAMERRRVGLGPIGTLVMYAGGLAFSLYDRLMGLFGLPSEAVYVIRPRSQSGR